MNRHIKVSQEHNKENVNKCAKRRQEKEKVSILQQNRFSQSKTNFQ